MLRGQPDDFSSPRLQRSNGAERNRRRETASLGVTSRSKSQTRSLPAIAPPPERRQVTLQELIEQLETIAAVVVDQPPRVRARRARPHPKGQAVRAITQLAHQENLSEIAAALERFLDQYWQEIETELRWLDFEELLVQWPKYRPAILVDDHVPEDPIEAEKHERVGVFWGLLYLSAQSKVELSQQEFYQDLQVRNLKQVPLDENDPEIPAFALTKDVMIKQ
ncbi:segregation/condensation protein A [Leptolyngbya sp. PCC 6406]|uniref:segregation/condensation protein A n=1 Tax=Leptolyngbya sp. PCC 6406 TaxID=1173264 RepID=UPI0006860B7D|nr:segregation/condensation protein A [Leptolyngbya sp. PCC 6406]